MFFNEWSWGNWILTCGRMKSDPYLIPYVKINPNLIIDLNVKAKFIKLLEETGIKLCDLGLSNGFLDIT